MVEKDMYAVERKDKIVELINRQGKASVGDLCDLFTVSASTIRNDLKELELEGLIKRTHGGAIRQTKVGLEMLPDLSKSKMLDEKLRIANVANSLIDDGDVIALSSGTTIFELVKTLVNKKNLTVIVNNIQMAAWLEENTNFTIVILGGILRNNYHFFTSPIESELLKLINIDKTFISINGIHTKKGITTADLETAMNYKNMINSSLKNYVLVDSSKFNNISFAKVMDVNEATAIITDSGIVEEDLEEFQKLTEVIVA